MLYKITLSNGKDAIQVNTDEELAKIMDSIMRGDKLVVCKQGIFNPSYVVSILPDDERYSAEFRYLRSPEDVKRKEEELRNESSPFAKALAGKFKMLDYKAQTEVAEQVAKEERQLKNS